MKELDLSGLSDRQLAGRILESIRSRLERLQRPIRLMEVCGTHTVNISRHGLRQLLPPHLHLLSGPGCPVCVTDQKDIDLIMELARERDVIVTTYGDMMRVPGSRTTLQEEKAAGCDVRVVYSPLDALAVARENPQRKVIFYAVGFETTAPMAAASLELAVKQGLRNFFMLSVHKTVPPALEALLTARDVALDGFILPGHVSTVIGAAAYEPLVRKYRVPSVIAGFEPVDVLRAVDMLLAQLEEGRAEVEIEYERVVTREGNRAAQEVIAEYFVPCDSVWRGIGKIPGSGLELQPRWAEYNARVQFAVEDLLARLPEPPPLTKACSCGEVLKGAKLPPECPLFGRVCTPAAPVGPCMVSSEGSCAAYYRYERREREVAAR
ncbi:MAG: hydrogenase formation protein HypD [Bacillota bacterium]|nr:hydrogenase formation protein HypD [Bacillota bacterium]